MLSSRLNLNLKLVEFRPTAKDSKIESRSYSGMAGKWDNFTMRSQSDVNLRPQKYLQKTYPPTPTRDFGLRRRRQVGVRFKSFFETGDMLTTQIRARVIRHHHLDGVHINSRTEVINLAVVHSTVPGLLPRLYHCTCHMEKQGFYMYTNYTRANAHRTLPVRVSRWKLPSKKKAKSCR